MREHCSALREREEALRLRPGMDAGQSIVRKERFRDNRIFVYFDMPGPVTEGRGPCAPESEGRSPERRVEGRMPCASDLE